MNGFVGSSIADLADALGVSKAAIYYHYRSKGALLHRLIDPLLDAIDALPPGPHHPRPPQPGPHASCWAPSWPS